MTSKTKFKYTNKIIEYLDYLEPKLHLQNYKIQIEQEATNIDSLARVEPNIYEKILYIQFSKKCNKKAWDEVRNILIHELIHGLLAFNKMVANQCNSGEAYDYQEEMFVNHITEVLCGVLE